MTQSLEQAIAALQRLPESDQDAIAALILAEINDQQRWDAAFAGSQDRLSQMAERVREDIRAGRTREAGMDEL